MAEERTSSGTGPALRGAIGRLREAATLFRRKGVRTGIQEYGWRLGNRYHEMRFGVSTRSPAWVQETRCIDADMVGYAPLGYSHIRDALKFLALDWRTCTFLDYGCGLGRALVVAASFPFRRVIGIEYSAELLAGAQRNLAEMKRRRAGSIDFHCQNAVDYQVPEDVNVIYFFNPFRGKTLSRVVANVLESIDRAPRRVHVIFFNPDAFDELVGATPQIRKIDARVVFRALERGIYVIDGKSP